MAKARSPNRDKAFELWKERGGKITNREIAATLGEDEKKIAVWKQRDKWSVVQQSDNVVQHEKDCRTTEKQTKKKPGGQPGNGNAKRHGAPKGNKNALGNKGGAPRRNKNAVKTGLHETIWLDCLDEKEQALLEQVDTDELTQVEQSIQALSIMEYRMFERLRKLMNGAAEKERRIVSGCRQKGEIALVPDEISGGNRTVLLDRPELVITEVTETEYRKIDDILKQERALLDVQGRKGRQVELKHKLQIEYERLQLERKRVEIMARRVGDLGEDESQDNMDSYYEALKGQLGKVWSEDGT